MTIHRAYGQIDRTAVREGEPLRVVMCSEGKQADGIDLRMAGARLDRFRANPVLGYGHSYWGRGNLPIGRVGPDTIAVDGARAFGDLEFDPDDEFARTVERKLRTGFLNAVSIGFEVTKWENDKGDYWRGGVAEEWELHELSVVPVPMDATATVQSGRTLLDDRDHAAIRALLDEFGPELLTAALARGWLATPPTPPAPEPPKPAEPAGFAVSESAARDLLAALKI